jgi:hypothetical protein
LVSWFQITIGFDLALLGPEPDSQASGSRNNNEIDRSVFFGSFSHPTAVFSTDAISYHIDILLKLLL